MLGCRIKNSNRFEGGCWVALTRVEQEVGVPPTLKTISIGLYFHPRNLFP